MRRFFIVYLAILSIICLLASPLAAYRLTLVGKVNDNFQIVVDNVIYEVKNNAVGDDLVFNYISMKVKVVGQISKIRRLKIITVESFEIIEE